MSLKHSIVSEDGSDAASTSSTGSQFKRSKKSERKNCEILTWLHKTNSTFCNAIQKSFDMFLLLYENIKNHSLVQQEVRHRQHKLPLDSKLIVLYERDDSRRTYGDIKIEPDMSLKPISRGKLPTAHPEVQKWFQNMDTKHDGKLSAKELQQAFEIFQGRFFSDSACKFVVRLFDLDQNGGLDIREFEMLYYFIKQWVNAFNSYDKDKVGFLDEKQFNFALKHMDIHFSPEFVKFLMTRSNPHAKKINLDQYIVTCIQIQRYTDEFKTRDKDYTGQIQVKYEDFLEMIMRCI